MSIATEFEYRCGEHSDIAGHLPYLFQRAVKAQVIVELGVRSGNSTAAFLAAISDNGGHLWSVDILTPQVPADWFFDSSWSLILGDDLDDAVAAQLPQACDLLFIDTCHEYRHTLAELDLYGPRVRSGGVILLHDTELSQAPMSSAEEDQNYPVRRAVEHWCRQQFLAPAFREGFYGLGVIEVT